MPPKVWPYTPSFKLLCGPGTMVCSLITRDGRPLVCGRVVGRSAFNLCDIQVHPDRDEIAHLNVHDLRAANLLEVLAWESQ
jgi:hypothetical protein